MSDKYMPVNYAEHARETVILLMKNKEMINDTTLLKIGNDAKEGIIALETLLRFIVFSKRKQ